MRVLNRVVMTVKTKVAALKQIVTTKRNGGTEIIVIMILLVIAIGLLVTFKSSIEGWLTTLTGYFEGQLDAFGVSGS